MAKRIQTLIVLLTLTSFTSSAVAGTVTIPAGTVVYAELGERVISKKKVNPEGSMVRASAWRNVVVDGHVVIRVGEPMMVRVSNLKTAKIAGVKGKIHLESISIRGVDRSEILLDGGYDQSGKGRIGLSVALFAVVAWPLIFIKGKKAVLESGTIFDAITQEDTDIEVEGNAPIRIKIGNAKNLVATVLYDDVDPDGNQDTLPLNIVVCGYEIDSASVVTINDKEIEPITVSLEESRDEGGCRIFTANVDLKALGKHFSKGINRFVIEDSSGARTEIILDVEL